MSERMEWAQARLTEYLRDVEVSEFMDELGRIEARLDEAEDGLVERVNDIERNMRGLERSVGELQGDVSELLDQSA